MRKVQKQAVPLSCCSGCVPLVFLQLFLVCAYHSLLIVPQCGLKAIFLLKGIL